MMWSLDSPFPVSGLYPGCTGIGSGVAFSVGDTELNLTGTAEAARIGLTAGG